MLKKKSVTKDDGATVVPFSESSEFIDLDGLRAMFGIKRSLAYRLLKEGAIREVSLRRPGRVRGKRLFDVASVRKFVNRKGERR